MRLDKYLAEAAVGTRKVVRNYVKEGKVRVNGQEVLEPALEIDETNDSIRYLGEAVMHLGKCYFMFHKPGGCVTARKDKDNPTVMDYFSPEHQKGLFPIGRLDKDTEGFLLLTNDGEFSHGLMHPKQHVEKTYFFRAFGRLDENAREGLISGVVIGDEEGLAKAIKIEITEQGLYQELKGTINLENSRQIRVNPLGQPVVSGYLTISEGRKHQVKRMLKAVGCYVVYLKRVSIGGVYLDETLEKGQYRELTQEEIRVLSRTIEDELDTVPQEGDNKNH
jgi:16S rRNA pseudouridine516 synthase